VKPFNPALAIQISADSIAELRRCDVFRVLEWTPAEHRAVVAEYVCANRPEFAAEVVSVLAELST
jgi:hypothetical protein